MVAHACSQHHLRLQSSSFCHSPSRRQATFVSLDLSPLALTQSSPYIRLIAAVVIITHPSMHTSQHSNHSFHDLVRFLEVFSASHPSSVSRSLLHSQLVGPRPLALHQDQQAAADPLIQAQQGAEPQWALTEGLLLAAVHLDREAMGMPDVKLFVEQAHIAVGGCLGR
jgi:hypothetical protein